LLTQLTHVPILPFEVLDLLANGLSAQQVLEELPDLELEDIKACLQYASRKLNHPVLVGA